jgi:hypothetical protein
MNVIRFTRGISRRVARRLTRLLLASLSIASGVMNTPQALEYTEGERIHQEALHAQANHRSQTGNVRIV